MEFDYIALQILITLPEICYNTLLNFFYITNFSDITLQELNYVMEFHYITQNSFMSCCQNLGILLESCYVIIIDHSCNTTNMATRAKYWWLSINALWSLALEYIHIFIDMHGCTIRKVIVSKGPLGQIGDGRKNPEMYICLYKAPMGFKRPPVQ